MESIQIKCHILTGLERGILHFLLQKNPPRGVAELTKALFPYLGSVDRVSSTHEYTNVRNALEHLFRFSDAWRDEAALGEEHVEVVKTLRAKFPAFEYFAAFLRVWLQQRSPSKKPTSSRQTSEVAPRKAAGPINELSPAIFPMQGGQDDCKHIWIIDRPNGPTSHGTCRICGGKREFLNWIPDSWDMSSRKQVLA